MNGIRSALVYRQLVMYSSGLPLFQWKTDFFRPNNNFLFISAFLLVSAEAPVKIKATSQWLQCAILWKAILLHLYVYVCIWFHIFRGKHVCGSERTPCRNCLFTCESVSQRQNSDSEPQQQVPLFYLAVSLTLHELIFFMNSNLTPQIFFTKWFLISTLQKSLLLLCNAHILMPMSEYSK